MRSIPVAFFALLAAVGLAVFGRHSAKATTVSPATNWTIHIDALKHFPGHPNINDKRVRQIYHEENLNDAGRGVGCLGASRV
jgi:hypothetical protein